MPVEHFNNLNLHENEAVLDKPQIKRVLTERTLMMAIKGVLIIIV